MSRRQPASEGRGRETRSKPGYDPVREILQNSRAKQQEDDRQRKKKAKALPLKGHRPGTPRMGGGKKRLEKKAPPTRHPNLLLLQGLTYLIADEIKKNLEKGKAPAKQREKERD